MSVLQDLLVPHDKKIACQLGELTLLRVMKCRANTTRLPSLRDPTANEITLRDPTANEIMPSGNAKNIV